MERTQNNTTIPQNLSDFGNYTEGFDEEPRHAFSNISFGLGCFITIVNVTTMCFLFRHRMCIDGTGFWNQLVFLCSTDILSGIAVALPQLGYFFFNINTDIYYSFCVAGIYLYPLSLTLTAGNCCLISIYRYVILRNLDKRNTKWLKYATPLMILGNILISIATVSSSVLVVGVQFGFQLEEFCDNVNLSKQNEYKSEYIKGTMIMLAIFVLATNVLSILSLKNMLRTQPTTNVSEYSLNIIKRNRYVSATFIIIVVVMNLTTVPTLLFLVVSINMELNVSVKITEIFTRLITLNSLLNPFIYSLRTSEFRHAVWEDVRKVLPRIECYPDA